MLQGRTSIPAQEPGVTTNKPVSNHELTVLNYWLYRGAVKHVRFLVCISTSPFPLPIQSLPHTGFHVEVEDWLSSHFCLWDCIKRVNWGEQILWVILDRKSRSYMTSLQEESAYIKPKSSLCSVVSHCPVLPRKVLRALKLLLTKWKIIALWLSLHLEDSTRELCKIRVIKSHKSASTFHYHSLCPANFPRLQPALVMSHWQLAEEVHTKCLTRMSSLFKNPWNFGTNSHTLGVQSMTPCSSGWVKVNGIFLLLWPQHVTTDGSTTPSEECSSPLSSSYLSLHNSYAMRNASTGLCGFYILKDQSLIQRAIGSTRLTFYSPQAPNFETHFPNPFSNGTQESLYSAGILTVQAHIWTEKTFILFVADTRLDMLCSFNCLIAVWQ